MKKYRYIIITFLLLLTFIQLWATKDRTEQKNTMEILSNPQESSIGGTFTLIDQNGKTVHDTDFRGQIILVAFGFTSCPDICPLTVSTLAKTLGLLKDKAPQVSAIFISVDPVHDTPPVMKDFLGNFDKPIVGLTGTEVQIKQVADAYKVYYAASAKEGFTDHSGYIYMMGKQGQFIRVFPYNAPEQEIANAIQEAMK